MLDNNTEKIPKLERCPHCKSSRLELIDTAKYGGCIGGNCVYVKCADCGHYAPSVYYDHSYMRFSERENVRFDRRTAIEIVAIRWNARTSAGSKRARRIIADYAGQCSRSAAEA